MRFSLPEAAACLRPGATVVTSTPLLAAALQRQFARSQLKDGRKTWPVPPILSVHAWMQQLFRDARSRHLENLPLLLSSVQEQMLWQDAIARSNLAVLDRAATARAAQRAAQWVLHWEIPVEHTAWDDDADTRAFHLWFQSIHERCAEERWLEAGSLPRFLAGNVSRLDLPDAVTFFNFDREAVPPALRALAVTLQEHGVSVDWLEAEPVSGPVAAIKAADFDEECERAARWIRSRLAEQNAVSIALMVPDLAPRRGKVERTLARVLRPDSVLAPSLKPASGAPLWAVHAPSPLAREPIAAAALSLLSLADAQVPMDAVTVFLCSSYIRDARAERSERAQLDATLRAHRELELPLREIENKSRLKCPRLAALWPRLYAALRQMPQGMAEPADWTRFWRHLTKAVGWPGDELLSPAEVAAVDAWFELLAQFDSLGLTGVRFRWEEAIAALRSMANAASGGPAADPGLPVQVLEPSDAAGLQFDSAWLLGGSELDWPPAFSAPPFVPFTLQRLSKAPACSAEGRRGMAQRLTAHITSSAPHVVVSYSGTGEFDARLSPLFRSARMVEVHDLFLWPGPTFGEQVTAASCEQIRDVQAPPVQTTAPVHGGTRLLQAQSECPFKAFARGRLRAESLEASVFSFDARDRGSFLHAALQRVWRELGDSDRLRATPGDELRALVARACADTLANDPVSTTFRSELRKAESERLTALILDWLAFEKLRKIRFRPRTMEEQQKVQISNTVFSVRADRVDELENGKLIIIDYKTGKVDREKLNDAGGRPREPQLLVYAAMLGAEVDGLYFAAVKRGEEKAVGYGRDTHFDDGKGTLGPMWEQKLQRWSEIVTQLAAEFEGGRAEAKPLPSACKWCELKPLCRIHEQSAEEPE